MCFFELSLVVSKEPNGFWGTIRNRGEIQWDRGNLKPRKSKRVDTEIRIFFTSGKIEGEGTVLDLSREGCRIECETPISMGTALEVWIFLPNSEWPLEIELAEVRWKKGNVFGVQFLKFRPLQEERFRKVFQDQRIVQKA